jgi:hypothetical protein
VADFVAYHNPDTMGYAADEVDGLNFLTNKNIPSVVGSRVWMLTGEDSPRIYYLTGHFTPTTRSRFGKAGFAWRIDGPPTSGIQLPRNNWPVLNDEEWFSEFRVSQGNFGLGLQAIRDKRYVRGLESALSRAVSPTPKHR